MLTVERKKIVSVRSIGYERHVAISKSLPYKPASVSKCRTGAHFMLYYVNRKAQREDRDEY
ncbi:hypothetical protein Plhal304r1_c084g0168511 [Plasmopara halstedii]